MILLQGVFYIRENFGGGNMAKIYIYESEIYTYYEKLIEFNLKSRPNEDDDTRTALNLNIILCSACLLEGVLEDKGKLLLGYFREV